MRSDTDSTTSATGMPDTVSAAAKVVTANIIHAKFTPPKQAAGELLRLAQLALHQAAATAAAAKKDQRQKAAQHVRQLRKRIRAGAWRAAQHQAAAELREREAALIKRFEAALTGVEDECLGLAGYLARAVIQTELQVNPAALANKIRTALNSLVDARSVTIAVHPDCVAQLRENLSAQLWECAPAVRPAAELLPGDLRLESPAGTVTLLWQEHLRALELDLRARWEQRKQEARPCRLD